MVSVPTNLYLKMMLAKNQANTRIPCTLWLEMLVTELLRSLRFGWPRLLNPRVRVPQNPAISFG